MIGRVYKIQHLDSSLSYIGSTCDTLPGRWRSHKNSYKTWVKRKSDDRYSNIALYPHIEQYGVDRFKMLLIKEYQVADKNQLRAYEQLAISQTKSCCNERAALQLINANSMARHYFKVNKDTMSKRAKEYYQTNKDKISKQVKEYRQTNKDYLREYRVTKVMCECGTESSKGSISIHRKSAKHVRLLAALNASQ